MIRKLFFPFALGAIVLVLAGCGKEEQIDPYTKASLREATYGEVTSDGFMYKIVNPTVIDTLGNFVVARQGNLTMFITGNNIARQAGKLGDPSKLTFNVVKRFKPMVHFQCTSIVSPTDSIVVENGESVTLPNTTDIG
ncbi:MAG: hypothetical protein HY770_00690 [Chitinivibrionia bacterium]|nr:hypothetical protein [Chitinivibrionia bacterium]